MNKLVSAKALAESTRSNPFKPFVRRAAVVDEPAPKKILAPVAVPVAVLVDAPVEVMRLPTYNPEEFAQVDYIRALNATEAICSKVKLTFTIHQQPANAKFILVQMLDTLGTYARILHWLRKTYGERVFEYKDDPLDTFLDLLKTGHSFLATPSASTTMPVAVFFYPTTSILEQLTRSNLRTVRIVIVLDDIYNPAAKTLRQASTTMFVNPLPRAILFDCLSYLRNAWNLSISPARQDYWLSRAADDPRILLHMLYFERLNKTQLGVTWGGQLNWDWYQWVNFWNRYGMQQLYELFYDAAIGTSTSTPGVVSRQILGNGKMSLVAWEHAKVPAPTTKTSLNIDFDTDVDMTLSYLHYSAYSAIEAYHLGADDTLLAYSETMDLMSMADLQQSRFNPQVLPMHQEAVRYGVRKVTSIMIADDRKPPSQQPFFEWLRTRKQPDKKAFVICEYAPLITIHRIETMSRLLFLADPNNVTDYWPTRLFTSAPEYEMPDKQYESVQEELTWRLLWVHVAQIAKDTGKLPPRPPFFKYKLVPPPPIVASEACKHDAFSWCATCNTAPKEPVLRCKQHCTGWGSCCTCAAYNRIIAKIVTCARAMEKI